MPIVSDFLIERLENIGVRHVFGVNAGQSDGFFESISSSGKMSFVNNVDESSSGFAADTYARLNGVGCVFANYNSGALKLCNSIAGCYAEKSPVIVVSISPPIKSRNEDFLLHHMLRSFDNQQKIFKNITCYSSILDDATKAGFIIDEGIESLINNKQPIYLEIPSDVARMPIRYDVYSQGTPSGKTSDGDTLRDSVEETCEWIKSSKNPVILVGVQVVRYDLSQKLVRFAEKHNIPMITTLLGKSSIDESHPLFAGVYCGTRSSEESVNSLIDSSDCLLVFGECLSDVTLGFESPRFAKRQVVFCSTDGLFIKNHIYNHVTFMDFCNSIFDKIFQKKDSFEPKAMVSAPCEAGDRPVSSEYLFSKINSMISGDKNLVVVSDVGRMLFHASRLRVRQNRFFSPAFNYSTGFAIPGSLGIQLSNPELRPIVLLSGSAFQISMLEIPSIIERKLNPIVFVIGDDHPFNFDKARDFFNGANGHVCGTEADLEKIIDKSLKSKELSLISVNLNKE